MLSEEEKEAIEFIKFYQQHCLKKEKENMKQYEIVNDEEFVSKNLDTVLNLITKLQKENEEKDKQFNILINSIPKQKIKDLLTEIQEEYNKLDKEIDKQIKDKNKDYYKCKENIAIMQTLAYCRDKFEGLLEEK